MAHRRHRGPERQALAMERHRGSGGLAISQWCCARSKVAMPDMGFRDNVMGPQPIAERKAIPEAVLEAAHRILDLLANGKGAQVSATAVDSARDEVAGLA